MSEVPSRLTRRVLLNGWTDADARPLWEVLRHPEVMKDFRAGGLTLQECEERVKSYAKDWEERGLGRWAVRTRDGQRLLGYMGFKSAGPVGLPDDFELGARLHPDVHFGGLATHILDHALDLAFNEVGVPRVYSFFRPGLYGFEDDGSSRTPRIIKDYEPLGLVETTDHTKVDLYVLTNDRYRSIQQSRDKGFE